MEKTAKACNNSACFFYIIGYDKINYNLHQKKNIIEDFIGESWPPLPPGSPAPVLTKHFFWQGEWALGYHSMKLRQFPDIS